MQSRKIIQELKVPYTGSDELSQQMVFFPTFNTIIENRITKTAGLLSAMDAARLNPELLQVYGALVNGDVRVLAGLIVSGAFLGIGYIIFSISALQMKAFPKIPLWFLMILHRFLETE